MARALCICRTQLTRLCLLPLLGAVGFWLLIPVLFGTAMLDERAAALVLEGVFPLAGALLLTPLFAPERRPGLLDCVAARRASHLWVCGLRAAAMLGALEMCIGDRTCWGTAAARAGGYRRTKSAPFSFTSAPPSRTMRPRCAVWACAMKMERARRWTRRAR